MRAESPRQVECAIGFGWIHKVSGAGNGACRDVRTRLDFTRHVTSGARPNFDVMLADWRRDARLQSYAAALGVSEESLRRLGATHAPPHRALAFPMRDADGKVIGIRLRGDNGGKWAVKGSNGSGMFFDDNLSSGDAIPTSDHGRSQPNAKNKADVASPAQKPLSSSVDRHTSQVLALKSEGSATIQQQVASEDNALPAQTLSDKRGDVKCEDKSENVDTTTKKEICAFTSNRTATVQSANGATLLICEGPTDTAAALSLGFDAIGLPQAHASEMFYALLRRLRPREIVVLLDADEVGQRAAQEICRRFKRAKNVVLPTKDLRELMSAALLRSLIDNVKI